MRGFLLPFPVAVRLSLKGKERAIHGEPAQYADAVVESNALPHWEGIRFVVTMVVPISARFETIWRR
jgi:hypothetical protein